MGWGGVITFMFLCTHRHSHLIIFLAVLQTQALLFHDQIPVGWGGVTLSDPLFGAPSEPPTAVTHMGCFTGTIAFLADLGMHLQILWKRTKVLARKESMLTVPLLMLWAGAYMMSICLVWAHNVHANLHPRGHATLMLCVRSMLLHLRVS